MMKKFLLSCLSFFCLYSQGQADCPCSFVYENECANVHGYPEPFAYTYPFNLNCDRDLFVTGEYLYWYGKESDLILTQKLLTTRVEDIDPLLLFPTFFSLPSKLFPFSSKWTSGWRVGVGGVSSCDRWDLYINWTYFKNKSHRKTSVLPFQKETANDLLLNPWSNPIFGTDLHFDPFDSAFYGFAPYYTQIQGNWREKLNVVDGEIGRKFFLSPCMTLRPYFGVRGAWDRNRFKVASAFETEDLGIISTNNVFFKSRYCGVGIMGGFQPNWYFTSCMSIFGNLDLSLLWGKYKLKRNEAHTGRTLELETLLIQIPEMTYSNFQMQPILDLSLGLRYESQFYCDRFLFGIDVAWEQHIWWNHNQRFLLRDGIGGLNRDGDFAEFGFLSTGFDTTYNDLTYGGLVVKGRFDF